MALDVSDLDPTAATESFCPVPPEWQSPVPQGLGAISDSIEDPCSTTAPVLAVIPDPLQMPPQAPKPHLVRRLAAATGLACFHIVTWSIQLYSWVLKTIFGYSSRQEVLYQKLHHVASTGNVQQIEEFLAEHAEDATSAGVLFEELSLLPELHIHLPEILKGANVCFRNDGGFFYNRWKEHPDAYFRISSHHYQGEACYAIGHFLFWLDMAGNSRFQFEKSPLRGFLSTINHIIDYLRYRRDNEQQGITGASRYTESHCLTFQINLQDYLSRQCGQ